MLGLILSAILTATPVTLPAQLKAAQPGDTVRLDPSATWGDVTPPARAWAAPGVTLDATGVKAGNLTLQGVRNLTVKGGSWVGHDWRGGIYVTSGSSGIVLQGQAVTGSPTGITVRGADHVTISKAVGRGAQTHVNILGSAFVDVVDSDFAGQTGDAVDISQSHDVRVLRNFIHDNVPSPIHPDGVQMWSTAGQPPVYNVEVAGNVIVGAIQGVNDFGNLNAATDNIHVHDNVVATSFPQGITFNWWALSNSRVERNQTFTLPGSKDQTMIREPSADPRGNTACGNSIDGRAIGVPCAR